MPSHSRTISKRLHILAMVLWLPFCCCQWQGAWALVGDGPDAVVASACGSGCCSEKADRSEPAPSQDGEEPCASSCCVRGEATPPKWELPTGRELTLDANAVGRRCAAETGAGRDAPHDAATDPPWSTPTQAGVRLQV